MDGTPYEGSFNSIPPHDIESITVLKDAAANSMYGARGSVGHEIKSDAYILYGHMTNFVKPKNFSWKLSLNGTHYRNKITKLPSDYPAEGKQIGCILA